MKKKVLICLLAVFMAFGVCACGSDGAQTGGGNSGSEKNNSETIAESKTESGASTGNSTSTENNSGTEENSDGIKRDADGVIILTAEEMKQYLEKTEITTENWKEYFEEWEETITSTDAFGEVTERQVTMFGIKREYAEQCVVHGLALMFDSFKQYDTVYTSPGELVDGYCIYSIDKVETYDLNGNFIKEYEAPVTKEMLMPTLGTISYGNKITYMEGECIKAAGEIIFVKIPDDMWTSVNNGDDFAVKWENADGSTVTLWQSDIKNNNTCDKISKLFE